MNVKIVVYAICKNEEKFVLRWMASMSEADQIVVLDTGSTDNTVQLLRELGADVTQEVISPWRFDTARNRSLELVPEDTDICVCTDLDEMFIPGWRVQLEKAWIPGTTQCKYHYVWSTRDDGDGITFWNEKIHSREGWKWRHPVHEALEWFGESPRGGDVYANEICLRHYPDLNKSRGQYLPLLELAVDEDPNDDRSMHYLGREYMYYGRWDDCIQTLRRHLSLPSANWSDERCASMRYIARSFLEKGDIASAKDWYLKAVAEAPHLREPYVDLAALLYKLEEWDGVIYITGCALQIEEKSKFYICEESAWGSYPHDIRSIALYQVGRTEEALESAFRALEMEPGSTRLQENVKILSRLTVS